MKAMYFEFHAQSAVWLLYTAPVVVTFPYTVPLSNGAGEFKTSNSTHEIRRLSYTLFDNLKYVKHGYQIQAFLWLLISRKCCVFT